MQITSITKGFSFRRQSAAIRHTQTPWQCNLERSCWRSNGPDHSDVRVITTPPTSLCRRFGEPCGIEVSNYPEELLPPRMLESARLAMQMGRREQRSSLMRSRITLLS